MADGYIQLPPDSSGKKLNTSQDVVNGELVHTQRVLLAGGTERENYVNVDEVGALAVTFAQGQPNLDAFGSLIVSTAKPLLTFDFVYDEDPVALYKEVAGSGTGVRNANTVTIDLTCTTLGGDQATLTSNKILKYIPGTGNRLETTVRCGDTGKANNTRRWGLFDGDNGVFFELSSAGLRFGVRTNTSGSPVESYLARAGWDDPLDGTGLSGMELDVTMVNIYWIDFQWLGAGAVRFGVFAPGGGRITAGVIRNANVNLNPYMKTGNLRLRYENINSGATGSTSELFVICGSVRRDGNVDPKRLYFGDINRTFAGVTGNDNYLIAVRPDAVYQGIPNQAVVIPENIQFYTDQPIRLDIIEAAVPTGPTWAGNSIGPLEFDVAASAFVGGAIRTSKICGVGATELELGQFFSDALQTIQVLVDGTQPVFLVAISALAGAASGHICFNYSELG